MKSKNLVPIFRKTLARKTKERREQLRAIESIKAKEKETEKRFRKLVVKATVKAERTLAELFDCPKIKQYIGTRSSNPLFVFNTNGTEKTTQGTLRIKSKRQDPFGLGIRGEITELFAGDRITAQSIWTSKENGESLCLILDSQMKISVAVLAHRQHFGHVFIETNNFKSEILDVLNRFATIESAIEILIEEFGFE